MSRWETGQSAPIFSCLTFVVFCPMAIIVGLILRGETSPVIHTIALVIFGLSILAILWGLNYNLGVWMYLYGRNTRLQKFFCRIGLYKYHCFDDVTS